MICPLFRGKDRSHQKDISKLTDIYLYSERVENLVLHTYPVVLYSNYQRSNKVTASIWSTKSDLPSYFMNIILLFKNFTKGTNVKREFHNFTTRSWRHDWPHNGLKHIWSRARIDKGQKNVFGVFNFLPKMNENKSTWGFIVVKQNSFARFLEETSTWKNHFDFFWPLVNWIFAAETIQGGNYSRAETVWGNMVIVEVCSAQYLLNKSNKNVIKLS